MMDHDAIHRLIGGQLRRFRGKPDYQDMYQECWVHVLQRRDDWLKDRCDFTTWAHHCIRGAVSAYVSRESTERRRNWRYGKARTEDLRHINWWSVYAIRLALECLTPEQRRILDLMFWCDLTVTEAARRMEITYSRAHSQLARATDRLRGDLGDCYCVVGPLRSSLAMAAKPAPRRNRRA